MSLEGERGRLFKNIHPLNGRKKRITEGNGIKRKSLLVMVLHFLISLLMCSMSSNYPSVPSGYELF